ncbi:MAG: Spy/CpxP family protein refolding chaperone [Proteobacteria bacterium]|nr:Spy/CpxP family protein refolding chaperone [Pseudomonadota bacterium]
MTRLHLTQHLACAALVAALAGLAAPSFAQPGPGTGPGPMAEQGQRPHMGSMTPKQRQQYMQKRAEAFKQKLQLTPAQEPAWTTFVQAMKPTAEARQARLDLQGMDKLSTPERIDRMRALRAQRAADMDRRGDAVKAFYATLTQAQQKTFDAEGTRMYGQRGHRGGQMGDWRGARHGMHRPGPGTMAPPAAPASQ